MSKNNNVACILWHSRSIYVKRSKQVSFKPSEQQNCVSWSTDRPRRKENEISAERCFVIIINLEAYHYASNLWSPASKHNYLPSHLIWFIQGSLQQSESFFSTKFLEYHSNFYSLSCSFVFLKSISENCRKRFNFTNSLCCQAVATRLWFPVQNNGITR